MIDTISQLCNYSAHAVFLPSMCSLEYKCTATYFEAECRGMRVRINTGQGDHTAVRDGQGGND